MKNETRKVFAAWLPGLAVGITVVPAPGSVRRHGRERFIVACPRIFQRGFHGGTKLILTIRQRRQAPLTFGQIARGRVEQHQLELMTGKAPGDVVRCMVVRKKTFYV